MKATCKITSIILTLALVLTMSVTAFAAWDQYQGNANHNGVINSAPTSTTPSVTTLTFGAAGWSGVDTEPVMQTTEDGTTYAYVLYNGGNGGGKLAKINCSATTPYIVWMKQISGASGFQLSTPLLVEGTTDAQDTIYLAAASADKHSDVTLASAVDIAAGGSKTVEFPDLSLTTASNRVAVGVYVGRTSVEGRGTLTTSGTASITLGSATASLTLSPTTSNTTTYKIFEEEAYENDKLVGYDYYYYINHNMTDSVGTGKNLSVTVSLTGGTGTIQYVDVYAQKAAIQSVTGLHTDSPVNTTIVGNITGQINTPIATDGTYLYFGTYSGDKCYYQVRISDGQTKTYNAGHNFYWAGATVVDGTVYFGSDDGYLFGRPVGDNFGTATGLTVNLTGGDVTKPGNVRSDLMYDGNGNLYFTSQGGYLWKYTISDGSLIYANIGGTSTSTPVISDNDILYIGCYGSAKKGVRALKLSDFTTSITNASDSRWIDIYNSANVQASVVAYSCPDDELDYVYFTTNATSGCGYCFYLDPEDTASYDLTWNTPSSTYTLQGMAACNGYLTFGNDSNQFYVVH